MQREPGSMENRYRAWLKGFDARGLDFCVILKRIWEIACKSGDEISEEDYFHLICFVTRVRQTQDNLVRRICWERNMEYWDTNLSRANCVYQRAKKQSPAIAVRLEPLDPQQKCGYLYRVAEHMLLLCNKREILDLLASEKEAVLYRAGVSLFVNYQSLSDLLHDGEIRSRARLLGIWLLNNWDQRHLNVLCHYYERNANQPSERLADESKANRDQLHKRIKDRLMALVEAQGIDKDVMRLFFAHYLPKICQQVPVRRAYNLTEDSES